MKVIAMLLTLLVLLIAGCSPEPTDSVPASLPTPNAVPSPSPEPAPMSLPAPIPESTIEPQVSTPAPEATSTSPSAPPPTPQLVWTVEPGICLEDASVPYVHQLEDGKFRMYYGGPGGILSAVSQDGLTFTQEAGVRVPSGSVGSSEMIVSDPTVVRLKDGRVRIYYKGATGGGGPGQAVHSIFSAVSADGLNFQKEGIRIDSQQTPDRGWASVPDAIVLPDGRVRIYYVSDGLDVKHGIVSAISDGGLNFTREGPVLTGFVDPAVIKLDDGYLMLAVALPFGPTGRLTDAEPGIYSLTSKDSIHFEDRKLVLPGENNIDPSVVDLGDGTYRVYYWNATDKPSAIKSIAGKSVSSP